MKAKSFRVALICIALVSTVQSWAQPSALSPRVQNTTLRMPAEPPTFGYSTTSAFPALSFSRPVAIVSPPGETNRLFIVEQAGRISVITNLLSPTRTVFADLTDRVQFDGGEEGLLALAFHPAYVTNRYFYVWYTTKGQLQDRLSRFEADPANPARALTNSEQVLISQPDGAENHNGGQLLFGPDGYLYFSVGDEGHDVFVDNVQHVDRDFFSGIFRIDVDKRPGSLPPNPHLANTNNPTATINYAIPPDNPFIGATSFNGLSVNPANVRTEFWAAGLRNPWRMSFDGVTGILYCADVGQTDREEVNIIVKGRNYGWPYVEGFLVYNGFGTPPAGFNPAPPILDYAHGSATNQGNCVTGGVVYRGGRYPELYGAYVFADYVSGNLWMLRYNGSGGPTNPVPFSRIAVNASISSFGVDPANGDILLAGHTENQIKRLVRASSAGPAMPATLADTGVFSDLSNFTPQPGVIPYDINVSFWSDYTQKTRWFSVPNPTLAIGFDPAGNWSFPPGSVWIKHFDLEMTNGVRESARRLETRILVRSQSGVYGVTYRWGTSRTNATLVPEDGMDESFVVSDGGLVRTQAWHYPGRSECVRCHTPQGGYILGFNSGQLNRSFDYGTSVENQILALSGAGYLAPPVTDPQPLPVFAHATNAAFSLEHRVRSYLAANCVQCHQPGGNAQGLWDARFSTPIQQAGIINGALINNYGDPLNKVVAPGSFEHSILLQRVSVLGAAHMPPLATSELNQQGVALLRQWISGPRPAAPTNLRVVTSN